MIVLFNKVYVILYFLQLHNYIELEIQSIVKYIIKKSKYFKYIKNI